MEILEEVLRRVKPGPEDTIRIQSAVDLVISRLKDLDAEVHGSFRKGTWLKGDTDVDLFVFYPRSVGKEYLAREALREILDRLQGLRTRLAYAEHPYVIVEVDGVEVDVVPALRVESGDQAITAVDRTPFHTRYVTSRLSDEGKDQVRLLKRFLKGIGVYGAEIRVMGFSGYVAELLTIYYGSFLNVLKGASTWKPGTEIVLERETKEFNSPLVIPDPVDPRRNAAAAVSMKSLATMSIASRMFLKEASLDFFYPPSPEPQPVLGEVLVAEIKLLEPYVDDVLWGQIRRSVEKIRNSLLNAGFRVVDVGWCQDERVRLLVQVESTQIGDHHLGQGPPFYLESSTEFILSNRHVWVGDDGKLYALKRRKEVDPERIILNSISLKYKYSVRQYKLTEASDDCTRAFLRKRPLWLK
ncbi:MULTISPECIES: CCA tRNA nucleotidyltransferase [Metallosphaera]|uniref:CCA-adding enzyme n=3 Tax=Metallosphaera TaxID=41980 RepID=A4YHN7_METS5|nr:MULTISPECIES: CCA tRNA nucleotidyltransferase [Metallosphaera]ABP95939.1 tRNA adenylyltransferase [Metallosphaera sedula DSM 5348]AIM27923.1 tRNA adenylyltransferase [Metallosphaera sedula]AKV74756.1 tRNA CCA-pyrophosphorylase [Metallosphaera sedula]AKV76992.1 tRNA CCA-pyrophosphorylase [Metallosphaera sedula]AKV79244.1 tRNA CCA-pyrophosphorylase [Metallosphaera sedula]